MDMSGNKIRKICRSPANVEYDIFETLVFLFPDSKSRGLQLNLGFDIKSIIEVRTHCITFDRNGIV